MAPPPPGWPTGCWRPPPRSTGGCRSCSPATPAGRASPYPAACRPQAWSAAAAGALVQALLGLDVDVPAGLVRIEPPGVPPGGAGRRLRVDGLVAGHETFSAGVDAAGRGYLVGCSLRRDSAGLRQAGRGFARTWPCRVLAHGPLSLVQRASSRAVCRVRGCPAPWIRSLTSSRAAS